MPVPSDDDDDDDDSGTVARAIQARKKTRKVSEEEVALHKSPKRGRATEGTEVFES